MSGAEALRLARELARQEGILCGTSGCATIAAALEIAHAWPKGARILCTILHTGERYLSTPLFAGINDEMNEAERAIAALTPGCRFHAPSPAPSSRTPVREPSPEAAALVERTIRDPANSVVMFALEWCEFCWSIRRLFADMGGSCHSVDLDSVACQRDDPVGDIRAPLRRKLDSPTTPQIFIGGQHIRGCTETLDAAGDGRLHSLLKKSGVAGSPEKVPDACAYLPGWIQRRPA